jgi:hypothetical protein
VDRAGALLKEIDAAKTGPKLGAAADTEPDGRGAPTTGRRQAAREAGGSEHQQKQAMRLAT